MGLIAWIAAGSRCPCVQARTGTHAVQEQVGFGRQLAHDLLALRRLEVQANALGAGHGPVRRQGHARPAPIAAGRFDADHPGAKLGNQGATQWAVDDRRQVQERYPLQGMPGHWSFSRRWRGFQCRCPGGREPPPCAGPAPGPAPGCGPAFRSCSPWGRADGCRPPPEHARSWTLPLCRIWGWSKACSEVK